MLTVAEVAKTFGIAARLPKLLATSATGKLNMDRALAAGENTANNRWPAGSVRKARGMSRNTSDKRQRVGFMRL